MPAENQPKPAEKPRRRPRFWVGPLVAGGCFALGFGVTQRLIAMQGGGFAPSQQTFGMQRFPGESLEGLQARFAGSSRPLMADVAAREAELAKTRPPKPKTVDKAKKNAERLAAEARRREQQTAARWTPLTPVVPAALSSPELVELMPAPQLPVDTELTMPAAPAPLAADSGVVPLVTPTPPEPQTFEPPLLPPNP